MGSKINDELEVSVTSIRHTDNLLEPKHTDKKDREEEDVVEENDSETAKTFPDGGRRAILVVFGCFLCLTGTLGITNANGTIENYISNNILVGESTSNISWIFALFNFMSFASILIVSPLYNQIGAKKMLIFSIVFFEVGIMCFSVSKQLYQFILSYTVCGLGVSFSFCCSINTVTHWFDKRRSTAVGCTFVGGGVGGIVIPIILQQLFQKVGFGWSIRILGFISLSLISSAYLLVQDRRKELGLITNHNNKPSNSRIIRGLNPVIQAIKQINFKTLTDRVFFTLVLSCMGNSGPFFLTVNYLVSYATANGWDASTAYYLPVVLNAMSIVGRVLGGYISDHYGRFNFFLISNLIACIAIYICWLPPIIGHSKPGLFIYAGFFGFTSGSYFQSSPTCVGQISSIQEFSARYGTLSCLISLFNFAMLPIGGAIVGDSNNSKGYDNLVIFVAVVQLFGVINIFLCRYLYGGMKLVKL